MKAIYDHKSIDINDFSAAYNDRGFQYGDGFFETMISSNGRIFLVDHHYKRICDALSVLAMDIDHHFNREYLEESTDTLTNINDCARHARVKLLIWRQKGGYYEPQRRKCHYLLTAETYKPAHNLVIENTDFCESVQNYPSPYSFFKRMSSLHYVMAGLEKKSKSTQDLIICDHKGNISEMLKSNIFWIKGNTFFTPSLKTGCIRGVMRSYLIDLLTSRGIEVREVEMHNSGLADADHIFSCNVTGLYPVTGVGETKFEIYPGLSELSP